MSKLIFPKDDVRNIDQKENMFIYEYIYMCIYIYLFIYLSFAVDLNFSNFAFQTDDIGDVYQDEENMAALLVQRDAKNGGILVVSSALSTALLGTFSPLKLKGKGKGIPLQT